jgi:hypothetical protein
MTRFAASSAVTACLAIAAAMLVVPVGALAHGGAETGAKAMSAEAEVKQLSMQPARVLAQQALVTLRVNNDAKEAAVRLDAALESKERSDIDLARLRQATETLDGGNPAGAIPLLDEALSRPLGSAKGKALHEAGREFTPGTGAQEIVGIILGSVLLLLGSVALWRGRRTGLLS